VPSSLPGTCSTVRTLGSSTLCGVLSNRTGCWGGLPLARALYANCSCVVGGVDGRGCASEFGQGGCCCAKAEAGGAVIEDGGVRDAWWKGTCGAPAPGLRSGVEGRVTAPAVLGPRSLGGNGTAIPGRGAQALLEEGN